MFLAENFIQLRAFSFQMRIPFYKFIEIAEFLHILSNNKYSFVVKVFGQFFFAFHAHKNASIEMKLASEQEKTFYFSFEE